MSADIIVDRAKCEVVKATLAELAYDVVPNAKSFQFEKAVLLHGGRQIIKIDLLSAPPADSHLSKVKINKPRIRPKEVDGIHAYLTEEARGLEIGKVKVEIPGLGSSITIVSNFNFLIFKLHAFADRVNISKSDYGRHHAMDIFYMVASMEEADWINAREHYGTHSSESYLIRASEIVREYFSSLEQLGIIRLSENQIFRSNSDELRPYLKPFITDLGELFPR